MGLKYSSFAIKGIDVSLYNGMIDWDQVIASIDPDFTAMRAGYGIVTDNKFVENWMNSKCKINRMVYWYMDYYSHINGWTDKRYTDTEWGVAQAQKCWSLIKDDFEGVVWLDIESSSPAYADTIQKVASRVNTIANAFLVEIDRLSDKMNGVYASVGQLSLFNSALKKRPLWVAWYNEYQTPNTVIAACCKAGWTGKVLIWQYASHGDIDSNGTPDGLSVGTQLKELDLNVWIGTNADYTEMWGDVIVTPEDETPIDEPVIEPVEQFVTRMATANLALRALPSVNSTLLGRWGIWRNVNVSKTLEPGVGSIKGWVKVEGQDAYMSADWLK
jgi:GH25 family lysozyme M1 (1,4-beta-N-acetylmuramidase)